MTTLGIPTTNKGTSAANGHLSVAKNKMGIHAMVNDDQEGDDLTSADEDNVHMDVSEDEHEDEEDEEDDDDELEQEDEEEEEEEEEDGDSHEEMEEDHDSETNGHHHAMNEGDHSHINGGCVDDVDMVEAHRAQGLVVSA